MRGVAIAAILDEGDPFTIRDQPVGQRMGVEKRLVPRPLAIEGEVGLAVVADFDEALPSFDPVDRTGQRGRHGAGRFEQYRF